MTDAQQAAPLADSASGRLSSSGIRPQHIPLRTSRRYGSPGGFPAAESEVPTPVFVVGIGKIDPLMHPPALFPQQGRPGHDTGGRQHILQFPTRLAVELPWQDVAAPGLDRVRRREQPAPLPTYPHLPPHQTLQRIADVRQVERLGRLHYGPVFG